MAWKTEASVVSHLIILGNWLMPLNIEHRILLEFWDQNLVQSLQCVEASIVHQFMQYDQNCIEFHENICWQLDPLAESCIVLLGRQQQLICSAFYGDSITFCSLWLLRTSKFTGYASCSTGILATSLILIFIYALLAFTARNEFPSTA